MENFRPQETTFTLPSGNTCTIRETNGEDEAIMSRVKGGNDQTSFAEFLTNIITSYNGGPKPRLFDVMNWKVNDFWYAILKSRIHSLGNEVNFKIKCNGPDCKRQEPISFDEDLNNYDWDLSKPAPLPGELDYSKVRIFPYNTKEKYHTFTLSSGIECRFKYKTFDIENKGLAVPQSKLDVNSGIVIREFEVRNEKAEGGWMRTTNFRHISSRDMAIIRNEVAKDAEWVASIDAKCPDCGYKHSAIIFTLTDFFFPGITL